MKKIIQLVILLASILSFSQNKLTGKITTIDNIPLHNAVIHITENNAFTETNESGIYTFKNVPKGEINLVIHLLGYEQKTEKINSNTTSELNITLQEKEQHLDEVIVSTAFNKIQSQNVMKVEHQSVKEMRKNGNINLMDGLAETPGVSQISTGTSIGKPVIRGLSASRVLVYAQGIRLENQQFGEEHGLGLSASGIESVEIIKGPTSLLYGSDAIGGVV